MALTHYLSLSELEELLVNEHVEDQMRYFVRLTDKDINISQLNTKKFTAIKTKNGEAIHRYPFLKNLSLGQHVVNFNEHTYTVLINKKKNFSYYVIYDETDFEDREEFYLITLSFSIAFGILFSLWFGYWISGKIVSPISRLSNQVGELTAGKLKIKLSSEYADDEVGKLAKAFEDFMYKLDLYVERERSFTADASHELRTPLAIIQGAVEVMLANGDLSNADTIRIERIERAARDMSQNLTALLTLAREPSAEDLEGQAELSIIIDDVIKLHQESYINKEISLDLDLKDFVFINAPANIVSVLVSNIIRNAFLYTEKGIIKIILKNNMLDIIDTGIGISEKDLSCIFEQGYRGGNALGQGSGLGLSLAKRICDYYNWKIRIKSTQGEGTTVTLIF